MKSNPVAWFELYVQDMARIKALSCWCTTPKAICLDCIRCSERLRDCRTPA